MPKQINANLTSWASELDDNALEQALRTSRLPILAGPVCLMADAHFGLGATVGSVVATKNALLPSAVGVDIGCGMVAAETNLTAAELPDDLNNAARLAARPDPGRRRQGARALRRQCAAGARRPGTPAGLGVRAHASVS